MRRPPRDPPREPAKDLQISPFLTCEAWPTVDVGAGEIGYGEPGYRDTLCSLLSETVVATHESTGVGLAIEFEAGRIRVHPLATSLRAQRLGCCRDLKMVGGSSGDQVRTRSKTWRDLPLRLDHTPGSAAVGAHMHHVDFLPSSARAVIPVSCTSVTNQRTEAAARPIDSNSRGDQ